MEKIKNFGQKYIKGELVNLDSASIEYLEKKITEIELEEKNIKNDIFNILELC